MQDFVDPALWLALAALGSGVALLHAVWNGRARPKWLGNAAGWTLVAVSLALLIAYGGPEFGPVYAVLALPLVAWVAVLANTKIREPRQAVQPPVPPARPRLAAVLRHAAQFLVAVPLAALAGALVSLTVAALLPIATIDRMATGVLLTPVAWGVLAYWACADTRLVRPAAALAVGGLACGLYQFA